MMFLLAGIIVALGVVGWVIWDSHRADERLLRHLDKLDRERPE